MKSRSKVPWKEKERIEAGRVYCILRAKLKRALDKLAEKINNRIDYDLSGYNKAVAIFEKTVDKLPCSVDSALQKSLCSFGKSITQVMLSPLSLSN